MEYCNEGNLDKFINNGNKDLTQAIMKGITNGVAYLHSNKIVHRDLKP